MNKVAFFVLAACAAPAFPQAPQPAPAAAASGKVAADPESGVPVFPYDITDRPYKVIGEVKAGVRKATIFSGESSQAKIYRELWERAAKLGADAVIKAQYGNAHVSAFSWGKTNATGVAIKFVDAADATPAATPAPATMPAPGR